MPEVGRAARVADVEEAREAAPEGSEERKERAVAESSSPAAEGTSDAAEHEHTDAARGPLSRLSLSRMRVRHLHG